RPAARGSARAGRRAASSPSARARGPPMDDAPARSVPAAGSRRGGQCVVSSFEAIPHSGLMTAVEERISDRHVLKLLRAMLRAGVMQDGAVTRSTTGTPQGGVMTAPTQKVTWVIGSCGGGDRVADGDLVVVGADQD